MDLDLIANNLLAGPILFFLFGFIAVALRSDLELPQPLPKLLSMYLVIAIGLKGGGELNHGLPPNAFTVLLLAIAFSCLVPLYCFFILRTRVSVSNAAAIGATYGSVSAVTFIAAISALEGMHIPFGGHMVAAMALMEAPAIVMGVILIQMFSQDADAPKLNLGKVIHDAVLHGPILLLLGSLVIGRLTSPASMTKIRPLFDELFPGVLCLYLFEMGLNAARRLTALNVFDRFLLGFAVLVPLCNAAIAIGACYVFHIRGGDAVLLTVLSASASYIAVPAAMQLAAPKADPSLYLTMALGITFPFNVAIGIPVYANAVQTMLPGPAPAPRTVRSHKPHDAAPPRVSDNALHLSWQ